MVETSDIERKGHGAQGSRDRRGIVERSAGEAQCARSEDRDAGGEVRIEVADKAKSARACRA
jgi:hypothetical protein